MLEKISVGPKIILDIPRAVNMLEFIYAEFKIQRNNECQYAKKENKTN